MKCQTVPKKLQWINKWFDDSKKPQPDTHNLDAWSITLASTQLILKCLSKRTNP